MMNYINNNTLILMACSSLMMNGCVAKNEFKTQADVQKIVPMQQTKSYSVKSNVWKQVASTSKEDCPDCYAKPLGTKEGFVVAKSNTFNNSIDYSKPPSKSLATFQVAKRRLGVNNHRYGTYDYTVTAEDRPVQQDGYRMERTIAQQHAVVNSSQGGYSNKTTVQIGAFRRYAGAQSYAKKYDLLSAKYHVKIETGIKDRKPLHRVRIEGFTNRSEAKSFIARYGISDAFLVIR